MSGTAPLALLFDKDGTLFDYQDTWSAWAEMAITQLAGGDGDLIAALAEAIHFDRAAGQFRDTSPIIACTNRECAEIMARALPGRSTDAVEAEVTRLASVAPLSPAVPLAPFLDGLLARGLALGVMTNDAESVAADHLRSAGVADRFTFVAGFDSGYGAKPDPSPLLAFAQATGIAPGRIAMVGDSTHDLVAGRAAGMQTIGVLTGMADHTTLAPHADAVFPDIGHISAWLTER